MKTTHRFWQLTVFSFLMVLSVLLVALEAANAGQTSNSVAITRGVSDVTSQTLTLKRGWNWVGFNVLPTDRTIGNVLGTTGFTVNDSIQTNGGSVRFTGASWTPESFTIEYGKLYQIYVSNDMAVVVNGVAGLYSLPLISGWNWIANSTLENAALSQLTHSGGWAENDRIQAAGGNGAAYISGKWLPSAFTLEAGKGYQVFAGNWGTLSFPTPVDEDTLYVVVDLSGGPDAASYPVRYTNTPPNLNDDTCRTTELWLRRIPKGTFLMGSPEDENVRQYGYDMEQHVVRLTQDYYIGVFECTQRQWELVMGNKPSFFDNTYYYATRPVEQVSYEMIRGFNGWPAARHAVAPPSFMGKLKEKTGMVFDLPTEAQWEYACRAGTTTALNLGKNLNSEQDVVMDDVGRYYYNGGSYNSQNCATVNGTAKVGSYRPNAWGLYDMHGNVWEWCLDRWGASTTSTKAETDPIGPTTGSFRVGRGGGFSSYASYCRSASRSYASPYGYGTATGFRVALHPKQDLYAVVDLSGGPNATSYPVRYTDTAPNWYDDTCRTTELWLRRIPKGTFIMGSPEDEVGRQSSDMAQHEVTITNDYYMGVFECTQRQWELVMGSNPSNDKGDCRPVERVSYNMIRGTEAVAGAGWPTYGHIVDASSFMGKLQAKTGLAFDLPTEAQWEYACRANTTTALNSGNNLTSTGQDANMDGLGRYSYNQTDGAGGYSSAHTTVGRYAPNAWGLYDMHGNVLEWCLDWWGGSVTSPEPETDPIGPTSGSLRVERGGDWSSNAYNCRSASRHYYSPSDCYSIIGFRVALHPKQDLYVVVDLSGGPDATSYPVRYTGMAPNRNDDTCRTTELWLRRIPKGTFTMGSPSGEEGRQSGYDMAQHEVTITNDYYIGVFECTQKQWELVMGMKPSYFNNDDYYATRPVEQVSYDMIRGTQAGASWPSYGHAVDSSSFMGKLQEKTGLVFDLPTEAQWEYACRAGTTTALNSGKNLTSTYNDANMSNVGQYYVGNTIKVGVYLPNALGLYDMHGNVWEWCLDWWGTSTSSTGAETDPVGPSTGSSRVRRGGSCGSEAGSCRSASRYYYSPTDCYRAIGFRVALHPKQDLYAVVDLSGGPDAESYPVRYTDAAPNLDDDTCRTTELWLRKIPKGTFIMGSPEDEVGRYSADMAQHEVTLTEDFYIGVFECTQKQWELVMGTKPSYFNNANYYATRPVEMVSYDMIRGTEAQAGAGWPTYGHNVDSTSFMGKLQAKTGLTFDLPTEAQWEYACRAGTATALNSGKNLTSTQQDVAMDEVGRYSFNGGSGYSQNCDPTNGTAKVGSYRPNNLGLYDMHGNVWEWCLDWWEASTTSTAAKTDPIGPNTGMYRMERGGVWHGYAFACRSADHGYFCQPNECRYGGGFRIICLP